MSNANPIQSRPECLKLMQSYLLSKCYVLLQNNNSSLIYYNTLTYELLAIVPAEYATIIPPLLESCDFISIIADSSVRVQYPDENVGIIYVDLKAAGEDSIIFAHPPLLSSKVIPRKRTLLIKECTSMDAYRPFWEYLFSCNAPKKDRNLDNAKLLVERGIQKFCSINNFDRADITDLQRFKDFATSDIIKCKLTVSEDEALSVELANPDTVYPETLLKTMIKMGLLE